MSHFLYLGRRFCSLPLSHVKTFLKLLMFIWNWNGKQYSLIWEIYILYKWILHQFLERSREWKSVEKMVMMGMWNNVFAFDQFFPVFSHFTFSGFENVCNYISATNMHTAEIGRNWKLCCMCKNVICDKSFPLQTFYLLVPHLTAVNFYTPHFMLRCCAT